MSDIYYTEKYDSYKYELNDKNKLQTSYLSSDTNERVNILDKDFDTLLSVNNS